MNKNMGAKDKMIRLTIAGLIAVLYFMNFISGTLALVLGAVAIIFALTSMVNFCPLYKLIGYNSSK